MGALGQYHVGDVAPICSLLLDALELSVVLAARMAKDVDEVIGRWREATIDRSGSAAHRLPALLVEQPVVSVGYVSRGLGITDRAARALVEKARERGCEEFHDEMDGDYRWRSAHLSPDAPGILAISWI